MPAVTTYKLPQVLNFSLTASDNGAALMNYPVNRSDFRVSKGVRTDVDIFIRDVDRKPVNLTSKIVVFVISNTKTGQTLMRRTATIVAPGTLGRCRLTILARDCVDWPIGFLKYAVLISNPDSSMSNLYTDRDYRSSGTLVVDEGPYPEPVPAITIHPDDLLSRNGFLYSGAYRADQTVGFNTAQITTSSFSGSVFVQATLSEQPDSVDDDWFDVEEISLDDETGSTGQNITGNYEWLRFKIRTDDGVLEKIVLRAAGDDAYDPPPAPVTMTTITMYAQGTVEESETLMSYPVTQPFTLPYGLQGSIATFGTAPSTAMSLLIRVNGLQVGSIAFPANQTSGVFTMLNSISVNIGDTITIVNTNADITAANLTIAIVGIPT